MTTKPVDPQLFATAVESMLLIYGNKVVSAGMVELWARIADIFNSRILNPTGPRPVVTAELGAGKTTCAKMYCALLPREGHPGVLIVVRTIAQAEEYADEINAWSGDSSMAVAWHSELTAEERRAIGPLEQYPVVIWCHAGYEIGMHRLANSETYPPFDLVHAFRGGRRRLVLIDESMDQLSAARISRGTLKQLGYDIPIPIERQHPHAMRVIQTAKAILLEADDRTHQVFDDPAWKEIATKESDLALARLWESLKSAKRLYSDRRRQKPDQEKKQNVGQIISALRRHLHRVRFPYLYGAGPDKTSIMGGGVLLPPRETVVLDATGTFNNVYRELADEYVVTELPKVRDYSEVTLHVELTNEGTGNATATQKPETLAKATLDAVVKYYGADAAQHRVLAVSHKNAEPAFKSYGEGAGFAAFDAAHYGAIDGRNTWSDFDTLIVPTLLYADPATAFLEYQELRQRQLSTDELNAPPDGVMLMQETHVVSALAQAMGRIRLRRVVDAAGRCEPCDVFARLPAGARMVESQRLLEALRDALPGLVVKYDWSAGSLGPRAKNYVPGSAYAETYGPLFIRAILGLEPGERMDVAEVRRIVALTAIGLVTDRTWDRVMKDAQTSGTQLQVLLQTAGGQVERVRRGRVWALELVRGATLSFPSIERK